MTLIATTALGRAFAAIINGLCADVGARVAAVPSLAVVLSQVYWHIARRLGRLDRLILRWHAGALPGPHPPRAARPRPATPRLHIPDSHAMPIHLAQRTAQYRVDIEIFLDRPDTRALLRVAPQAVRILRPLCRILAIDLPEHLRAPPPGLHPPAFRPTIHRPRRIARCPPTSAPPPAPGKNMTARSYGRTVSI